MLEQLEGSQAIARVVAACRPEVVCAYPITPQTHIVEALGVAVRTGRLGGCAFVNVESEFGAMSVCIGAAAAGSRAYTATSSQGLLFMTEAVYNAAGLGLPLVMTVANRAIGAPINIWNDHSDAMALRDSGWVQLYAEDNQQAVDLHPVAYRLAEALSVPVMVCVDGFALTHAVERIDVPFQAEVDRFLPRVEPRQRLDPDEPLTIGAMVGPDAFEEVRYLAHVRMRRVFDVLPELASDFARVFGRAWDPFVQGYRLDGADTVVVAQGSVFGTLCDAVDRLRDQGRSVGCVSVTLFRPFPVDAVRAALAGASQVVVVDRALATGGTGFLFSDVAGTVPEGVRPVDLVAGLGGRTVTVPALVLFLADAIDGKAGQLSFLGLDRSAVASELALLGGDIS